MKATLATLAATEPTMSNILEFGAIIALAVGLVWCGVIIIENILERMKR